MLTLVKLFNVKVTFNIYPLKLYTMQELTFLVITVELFIRWLVGWFYGTIALVRLFHAGVGLPFIVTYMYLYIHFKQVNI